MNTEEILRKLRKERKDLYTIRKIIFNNLEASKKEVDIAQKMLDVTNERIAYLCAVLDDKRE